MINLSFLPEALFYVLLLIGMWAPGTRELEHVEPPKKGYWTVGAVFWPIRKAYRDLWPSNADLKSGVQLSFFLAFWLTAIPSLLEDLAPRLMNRVPPGWYLVELAIAAFLIGRASGFWSADRRIAKEQHRAQDNARG